MSHSVRLTISWAFVMWWHVLITETHNTKLEQWHPWFMEVSFGLVQGLKHFLSKDVQKHQWGNWMGNQLLDLEPLQKVSTVPLYTIYYTYNCSCSLWVLILVSFNQFLFFVFRFFSLLFQHFIFPVSFCSSYNINLFKGAYFILFDSSSSDLFCLFSLL